MMGLSQTYRDRRRRTEAAERKGRTVIRQGVTLREDHAAALLFEAMWDNREEVIRQIRVEDHAKRKGRGL